MSGPGPVIRFSRDKKGYEHFYLVQPSRRPKGRPRLLYWFRTPPGIKVGREAFDAEIRRAIERQNPDVTFDWDELLDFTVPSADDERWRERRRERQAARAAQAASSRESEPELADESLEAAEPAAPTALRPETSDMARQAAAPDTAEEPRGSIGPAPGGGGNTTAEPQGRRRRRRRRRRRDGSLPAGPGLAGRPQESAPEASSSGADGADDDDGGSEADGGPDEAPD